MAATKLDCRFLNRKQRDTNQEHMYETKVCTTKMNGMMARSVSFSAVSWDASFVKTTAISYCHYRQKEEASILRHGVNSATFRLATSFCASASNMPWRAAMYPGRLTQTTSSTASKTSRTRCMNDGWLEWGDELLRKTPDMKLPSFNASCRAWSLGALSKPLATRYEVGEVKMAMEGDKRATEGTDLRMR